MAVPIRVVAVEAVLREPIPAVAAVAEAASVPAAVAEAAAARAEAEAVVAFADKSLDEMYNKKMVAKRRPFFVMVYRITS